MTNIDKTIGSLNGWQVIAFRINLILLPIVCVTFITFGTWIVKANHSMEVQQVVLSTESKYVSEKVKTLSDGAVIYTKSDAVLDHHQFREELLEAIRKLYSPGVLEENRKRLMEIELLLHELQRPSPKP